MDTPDLRALAALGEFFVLPPAPSDGAWEPVATLCDDAGTLRDYVLRTRRATATGFGVSEHHVPVKAAASSLHLSITARLLSPAIGAAACLGAVPRLASDSVVWQRDSSHRPILGTTRVAWTPVGDARRAAGQIVDSLVDDVLRGLNATLQHAVSLSPQVMWGNIASAANGAVTVLAQNRPDVEAFGRALVAALIDIEPLAGCAELTDGRFRRRNCCLFYQVPGGGYCGDCVLVD
jgi:hypothetical protein